MLVKTFLKQIDDGYYVASQKYSMILMGKAVVLF